MSDDKDKIIAGLKEEIAHLRGNIEAMRQAYERLKARAPK
jgi:hypothetical protein